MAGKGVYRAAERLKKKRRANSLIPDTQVVSRQVKRRQAIETLKAARAHLKKNAMKHRDPGGMAAVTVDDVAEYIR